MKKLLTLGGIVAAIIIFGVVPAVQAETFSDLQNLLNRLRDQVLSLRQTAVVGMGTPVPLGTCPASIVGVGKVNETLRCNGSRWVANN